MNEAEIKERVAAFLAEHDPSGDRLEFLRARFDAGLAWVWFPEGLGGLGVARELQQVVERELAGTPQINTGVQGIGLGMAAPTILAFGTEEQKRRFLRPLWTGEEIWCQLFSEPGAGSDLATLATRAVRDSDEWVVDGQKVWTSGAHHSRWGILVTRTDPDVPKHRGMTYFVCDMHAPGVEVRPLRQITGEAEFNEVFLTGVRLSDDLRLGEVGDGWRVAQTTLMNERVAIGGAPVRRGGGMVGPVLDAWHAHPELRTHDLHQRLLALWVEAEVTRLSGARLREQLVAGQPGPEGSGMKLSFAKLNQALSGFEVEFERDLGYDDWTFRRSEDVDFYGRGPGYRYLRAKGNSIEGGTSEILRNIIAERVLGLPSEPRVDKDVPWKDLPR
ncbi:alkylation response protein AidB-like acyl-CoA dehydrogenase [Nonomuraea polychroma]|uniref:Alkylation response protein AidB-like acyl-CoA dehydrogenase n=1 Tax=Nonomuraea polychroma TaxID=46176 RepID=A0A438ME62_9ACTN|nr:acyl-CoA dehydrogenase family protein [Nonomuraea polychroma]RVX44089.1 alkylation response protein AidB-like acyl-CoA dehydrogenase [Nonomuraea polychroma]